MRCVVKEQISSPNEQQTQGKDKVLNLGSGTKRIKVPAEFPSVGASLSLLITIPVLFLC